MMQAGQKRVEIPSLMRCPRGSVGTLETLGCRFFGKTAQVAVIAKESAALLVGCSDIVGSDIAIIAKSPQNTSGSFTYISQPAVILTLS